MTRHLGASRFALWAVACALVLKSAVPLLASAAAGLQGRPVAEVCDVYGVVMPATDVLHPPGHRHPGHAEHGGHAGHAGESEVPAPHEHKGSSTHGADHCALTALAAGPLPGSQAILAIASREVSTGGASHVESRFLDACAEWAAQLRHAPPTA